MPAAAFNINQEAVIQYTHKLSKLHKSDLPLAVRGALNDVAFEAKKKVPKFFESEFIVRKKTFLRSHTGVIKCPNTFDLKQMVSQFGIIKGKSNAGDNLVHQEYGGIIADSEFIPMKPARIGGNERKLVSKRNYLRNIKGKLKQRPHENNEFRRAAIKGGKGSILMFNDLVLRVDVVKTRPLFIKTTPLYYIKDGKKAQVKPRPFMRPASRFAMTKMPRLYIQNAEYRIKKRMSKFMK